ncbi:MAG TPA: HD domain-containing phosphohydrolase [Chloroflexota bacterium]|nr:HD domain-containing phosphohydrolase [Chloroflexota bacterium]
MGSVIASDLGGYGSGALTPYQAILVLGLSIAVLASQRFPVQVHVRGRVSFTNVPLYLMAVFLPPTVAGLAAFVSTGAGAYWNTRRPRKSILYSVVYGARWNLFVLCASTVGHSGLHGSIGRSSILLLSSALIMWMGDALTTPLVVGAVGGESYWSVVAEGFRLTAVMEICQYLVAVLGAAAAIALPWSPVLLVVPVSLLYLNTKRTNELQRSTSKLLENLADAVDLRDANTGGHSRRVTEHVRSVLPVLEVSGPELDMIVSAARVHDIGKIGVPDSVLKKAGTLTSEERGLMEGHAAAGAQLLARHEDFRRGCDVVRHHHEAWDGSGYPDGLSGYDIPFGARVLAVADSYDAMTSDRPYRRGMSHAQAAAILQQGRGRQWDAAVVDAFLSTLSAAVAEHAGGRSSANPSGAPTAATAA